MPEIKDLMPEKLTKSTIGNLQIASPGQYNWINLLVYGEPGVGKTRLSGSSVLVPEMQPVLLLDYEGGTLSLAGDMREVDVVRPTDLDQLHHLYESLFDENPYKTVILDSLSEMQKTLMQALMREVVKRNPDRDPDVAGMQEWGKNSEQVRRVVRAFRDLPCNTIFTALAEESKDERSGINKIRPGLPGKLKAEIAGYVDIVLYMYRLEVQIQGTKDREIKTLVLTQGTERQVAKDRSGTLPMIIESPTMTSISGYIQGREKENETEG